MGKDDDIIVATFKVLGKEAARDLESFIEKGYDWVIDAETSAGEISDGKYIVFIEAERRTRFPAKFMGLINDLKNSCKPISEILFAFNFFKSLYINFTCDLALVFCL